MTSDLSQKHCVPCEGGVPPLPVEQVKSFLAQVPEWTLADDEKSIYREFKFKGFYKTMSFINVVAWLANREGHHPDMTISYNQCRITYTTHAADGLTENDFICASQVDALEAE